MQFFSILPPLPPLRPKYSPTLFSDTFNLCFALSVRGQVSQQYKTTGKIMVLYTLIFKFLERWHKDRRLWTERQQAFLEFNLECVCECNFDLLLYLPNTWNFPTKYLLAINKSWFCPAFWWQGITIYLLFYVLTSRPTSFVLFFAIYVLTQYIHIMSIDQDRMCSIKFLLFLIFLDLPDSTF